MGTLERVRSRQLTFADCLQHISAEEAGVCIPSDSASFRVTVFSLAGMIDISTFPMIEIEKEQPDTTHVVIAEALSGGPSFAFYPPEVMYLGDGREIHWRKELHGRASRYITEHWEEIFPHLQRQG